MEIHTKYKIVWRDRGRLKRLGRLWRPAEIHANAICVERPNETRETQETKETMETYHGDIYHDYNTQD